ncbi:MutS-related protein [Anaerosacchariphilus polymeriproducens]|nr:mannonate oxidoreductase [Anaerosacchariphilus polymeriproducens]
MFNYEKNIKKVNDEIEQVEKKFKIISNLRLFIGLIGILFLIFSVTDKNLYYKISFVFSGIIFLILVMIHKRLNEELEYLKTRLFVINKREDRNRGDWIKFEETGEVFLTDNSNVERNLDILGKDSLYQYLCVASTPEGKKKLAAFLMEQDPKINIISERQEAVKDLLENQDFAIEFEILSMLIDKKNEKTDKKWYESFLRFLEMKEGLMNPFLRISSYIFPILLFLSIGLYIKGVFLIQVPLSLLFIQTISSYFITYRNRKITNCLFRFCTGIDNYVKIVKSIEKTPFKSEYLKGLQKKIGMQGNLSKGIYQLYHLKEALMVRTNPYIHIFLQVLLMYDIHCIKFLEKWKKEYGSSMFDLFQVIGELEALISLSILGVDRDVVFPIIVDNKEPDLEVYEAAHPLIAKEKAISNSFKIEQGIQIITGSNMSGKTTFMRTIGINMVLAYAGAPVCAKEMKLSKMKIFTSMRVMDDVTKGISSFYGEVLRIKEMIEYAKQKKGMMVLIDEIFKGTNSSDRIIGAKEIIKNLNKKHIIALISTHDFELCNLIDERKVKGTNHHFQEYYEEDKICFDYKLRDGKCRTTNAKYILKMAGLLEEKE